MKREKQRTTVFHRIDLLPLTAVIMQKKKKKEGGREGEVAVYRVRDGGKKPLNSERIHKRATVSSFGMRGKM